MLLKLTFLVSITMSLPVHIKLNVDKIKCCFSTSWECTNDSRTYTKVMSIIWNN